MSQPPVSGRRAFLQQAVHCGFAWGGATLALGPTSARAIEPLRRNGRPHFKLSLAAYSFREELTGKSGKGLTLDDFVRLCADYDLDGTELTSYYFPKDFDEAYLRHLKQLTFRLGLDISGTAIANDFCLPEGEARAQSLAHTRRWIDHAALLGAPVIRIFAGSVPTGDTAAASIDRCVAGIHEALDHAEAKGVCLALENHGGITDRPEQMLQIVRKVRQSPWFGVNFDGGNFRSADPYADLAQIAPYALNVQIKTDIFRNNQREDTDLERVLAILKSAGYRGYIVLEYESSEDPRTAVPKHLQTLRRLISRS